LSDNPNLTVVGLGPGDPELVTVKGVRAIESADVIFVPRSTDSADSVALSIAQPWLSEAQTVVLVTTPMTRNIDTLRGAWQSIAAEIASTLQPAAGPAKKGVYLILGDPLLYGTFTYIAGILTECSPQIDINFIPGITSFAAGAAETQTPLGTSRDRIAIIPASRETNLSGLRRLLVDFATIILMKAGPVFPQIMEALESLDLVEQSLYAERVGLPDEKIVRGAAMQSMARTRQPYLSLMIVRRGNGVQPVGEEKNKSAPPKRRVYPVNLSQIAGKRVVVVGGGPVGQRKIKGLLAVGAQIDLISPKITGQLQTWANATEINWLPRPYQSGDLTNATLVFAATNQRAVNAQIAREAAKLGILCNVADAPGAGDFHLPAVHRQPGLVVAVSTSGKNPGRAAQIRNRIAAWLEG